MRRAIHHGTMSSIATPRVPLTDSQSDEFVVHNEFSPEAVPLEVLLTTGGTFTSVGEARTDAGVERSRDLAVAIMQRIESRLPGRVRNLAVRIRPGSVVLEGQCATYYTKQLAQHAALGILEDEHLENAIVVAVGR